MSHTLGAPDLPKGTMRGPSVPRRSQAHFVARAKKNTPIQLEHSHPFTWWRTRPAYTFKHEDIFVLRAILRKCAIIGEPHWFLAVKGDPAVALGVALRLRKQPTPNSVSFDLAMTAVLCVAHEGDAAAALLLSATLKARCDTEPLCSILSESWLSDKRRKGRFIGQARNSCDRE